MLAAINMRTEFGPFFTQFTDTGQRKHLKTTTIGQHRTVESIELMQSTGLFEYIQSRPQIKMICISQNDLCLNILFQFSLMYSFHTADCTYRHKYRGLYLPVVCCNQTGTGITFCVCIL